jgi:hypothetical protein
VNFRCGDAYHRATSKHCLFDMSECWTVKTHPRIDSISKSTGYISGGQLLDITGVGLKGTDVQVIIDGIACAVQSATSELITCKTGAASSVSTIGVT